MSRGGIAIKESLKQFLGLLLLGQVFLVGAIVQDRSLVTGNREEGPAQYAMQASGTASAVERVVLVPPASSAAVVPTSPTPSIPASATVVPAAPATAPEEIAIQGITHREDAPFQKLEIDLAGPVRFAKLTHRGKLLRLRVQPALTLLAKETADELGTIFQKFSQYRGPRYSEFVFYAGGKIGEPYLATSAAGLTQLVVPFQAKDTEFPLPGGETLAEGVTYFRDRVPTAAGPADVFLLRVEPFESSVSVVPVLANEGICQKEILSSIGRRYDAVAAINGCYFTQRGDPIGTLIINRRLISSPLYNRSVFGISTTGTPLFGNPDFSGALETGADRIDIDAVNQPRAGDSLVIFTPEFARSTMTAEPGKELVLVQGRVVGIHERDAIIPPDGVVVSAGGRKAAALDGVRLGDAVTLDYRINPPWTTVQHAVCGGPRLLADGRIDINGKQEKFDSSITNGRHPRTAVAQTYNGDLLFLVVDGRSARSAGMTLMELASYLKRLGGRHGINLDGGGSSTMLVKGRVVNRPSDGRERPISNGIVITKN
ncbi:MAG: hypothetical protein GX442_08080 [Candidatus Riflebacteria bacterium]|nr:hypothetical protein [Candidatus Riflebacteria bacterium]